MSVKVSDKRRQLNFFELFVRKNGLKSRFDVAVTFTLFILSGHYRNPLDVI